MPVREAPLPRFSRSVGHWQLFANPGESWPESVPIPLCLFMVRIGKRYIVKVVGVDIEIGIVVA